MATATKWFNSSAVHPGCFDERKNNRCLSNRSSSPLTMSHCFQSIRDLSMTFVIWTHKKKRQFARTRIRSVSNSFKLRAFHIALEICRLCRWTVKRYLERITLFEFMQMSSRYFLRTSINCRGAKSINSFAPKWNVPRFKFLPFHSHSNPLLKQLFFLVCHSSANNSAHLNYEARKKGGCIFLRATSIEFIGFLFINRTKNAVSLLTKKKEKRKKNTNGIERAKPIIF